MTTSSSSRRLFEVRLSSGALEGILRSSQVANGENGLLWYEQAASRSRRSCAARRAACAMRWSTMTRSTKSPST
jgi:hypothetical protein